MNIHFTRQYWNRHLNIIKLTIKPTKLSFLPFSLYHSQLFNSSSLQSYNSSSANSPRRRIDQQITSEWIQLVDPTYVLNSSSNSTENPTNNSLLEPSRTRDVLSRLDLTRYALIEVNGQANPPICKVIQRTELSPVRNRNRARPSRSLSLKEFQISSLIQPHDLETKLRLASNALEKGHRVRIIINLNLNGPLEFSELVEERMIEIGAEKVKEEREGKKLIVDWSSKKLKKK
ncbi:hypothetical protein DFH28DRAFT_491892 [Melampsora americana]|nr:hypothetical protein DFH28DRAFT_491892 [Melampsora americana]